MTIAKIFRVTDKTVDVKSRLSRNFNSHDDDDNNIIKTIGFMSKTTALHMDHSFFDVHCTTTTRNLLMRRFLGTWTYDDEFSFSLFLNLDKVLKNSTPGKIAYIWQIEQVQRDAIKFKTTEIYFLATLSNVTTTATEPRTGWKKKTIGLDWQNNNIVCASRFFVHFFAVTAHYNVKLPNFTFYGGREQKTTIFFFFLWT